jgi:hypothetical protein
MALRLQKERMSAGLLPSMREYSTLYQVTEERLAKASTGALVMHPGPMNEGIEISPGVASSLQAVIEEQVTNGVAVRMALLYLLTTRRTPLTTLSICGGRVIDPANGVDEVRDVVVDDGVIAAGGNGQAQTIDAAGLIAAPGLVDIHTHLREPGFEHKETIETGTLAAAGRVTTSARCPTPNRRPIQRRVSSLSCGGRRSPALCGCCRSPA